MERFKEKNSNNPKEEHLLLKQPNYILTPRKIKKYFPNSKIINIIRDGRDATISAKKHFYKLGSPAKFDWFCRQWVVCLKKGKKLEKNPNYMEVFYEDLLKKPEKTMNEICNFLNIKPISREKINNFHKKNKSKYSNHPNVKKPLNPKIIGKGKKEMTEKDKKTFKKIAGKELIELGYEKDNNW